MFIDTHAHLNFEDFKADIDEVLGNADKVGVGKILNIGCDYDSSMRAVELADKYEQCYATLGFHPYDGDKIAEEVFDEWEELVEKNKKIVAIGECGLDYFKSELSVEVQEKAFRRQVEFAIDVGLPLVIHNRDADEDCLALLTEYLDSGVKAVFHCYGSDLDFAEKVWDVGFLTSFTGIVTFPNAGKLQEVVKNVPLDRFMIETDCPYLAPQRFRGKRNEPAYVFEIAQKIAELKGLEVGEIEKFAFKNSLIFFERLR